MKAQGRNPRGLDVSALCREGLLLEGEAPLSAMSRLADSLSAVPADEASVPWQVQGQERPVTGGAPERWMHLRAQALVPLQCQRCLQTLAQPMAVDRWFRFARSEAEAERLDEELEEDVLVQPARLDLLELLEDELILALPIVPRHEGACPQPLPAPAADALPEVDGEAAAPNPFAALAALRGGGKPPGTGNT
jgi:uncharacterized protein